MNLSSKQKLFCDSFILFNSVSEAAKASGYSTSFAYSLLKKPHIKDYLSSSSPDSITNPLIAQPSEILQYLTLIIRDDSQSTIKDKIKAAELLGKALSIFNPKTSNNNSSPVVFIDESSIPN